MEKPKETIEDIGLNIFNLTEVEKEILKNRIEAWNGLVRIFVHPMYEKWRGHEDVYKNDPQYSKLVEIEEGLAKILSKPEAETPPVIIMEEANFISQLKDWLENKSDGVLQTETYFVETQPNNPTPNMSGSNQESWESFITLLQDLGVKKIILAGMQFLVDTSGRRIDWTDKDPFVGKCIGWALSYLSKDKAGPFEVELSGLIEPSYARTQFNDFKRKGN